MCRRSSGATRGNGVELYPIRSATTGSAFAARCAGSRHATNADIIMIATTAANVSESVALIAKSSPCRTRVSSNRREQAYPNSNRRQHEALPKHHP
jgi:hypothetical protein